jgi:hypothetical protein
MPIEQTQITVNISTSDHFFCPSITRRLPLIEGKLVEMFKDKTISVFDAYRHKRHGAPETCKCVDVVRRENWFMLCTDSSTFTKNELVILDEQRGMAVFLSHCETPFYRIVTVV